jgi:hypothetical protein
MSDRDAARRAKEWVYAGLGIVVLVVLVMIATGTVQISRG